MDHNKLQKLLDSLDEGPLGKRKDYEWDASIRLSTLNTINNPMKKDGHSCKLKNGWKPYTKNFELHNAKTSKPIGCYSKEGKLLKQYPSMNHAAKDLSINRSGIRGAILRNGTAGGFFWKQLDT